MIWSRAALLINASGPERVERETGTLPGRATCATKIRTASGNEVPNSSVTFAARLSSFGSTRHRKSTVMLQMCHKETPGQVFLVHSHGLAGYLAGIRIRPWAPPFARAVKLSSPSGTRGADAGQFVVDCGRTAEPNLLAWLHRFSFHLTVDAKQGCEPSILTFAIFVYAGSRDVKTREVFNHLPPDCPIIKYAFAV